MPGGHSEAFAMVGWWVGTLARGTGTFSEDLLCFPVEIILTLINSRKNEEGFIRNR